MVAVTKVAQPWVEVAIFNTPDKIITMMTQIKTENKANQSDMD